MEITRKNKAFKIVYILLIECVLIFTTVYSLSSETSRFDCILMGYATAFGMVSIPMFIKEIKNIYGKGNEKYNMLFALGWFVNSIIAIGVFLYAIFGC